MDPHPKVRLIAKEAVLNATLIDSAATRDFVAMLPLELTLSDCEHRESVRLAEAAQHRGVEPDVGDITYYAPSGNLAIFYRDFGYAKGLVKLGHIDAGSEKLGRASVGDAASTPNSMLEPGCSRRGQGYLLRVTQIRSPRQEEVVWKARLPKRSP